MRKYWQIYKMKVAQTMIYRGSVIVYRLGHLLSIGAGIAVWLAAEEGSRLGGFTKNELVTYYIIAMLLQGWIYWSPMVTMKEEISTGDINSKTLSKPVSYFWQKFTEELGWHTVSPIFALIPAVILVMLFHQQFILVTSPTTLFLTIVAAFFGAFVQFGLSYCIGLIAFWFTEIAQISSVMWMGLFIFGGQVIPVSFFPDSIRWVVNVLPFRVIFSFPMELYLGKLHGTDIISGFVVQFGWIIIFWSLARFFLPKGLRVYSAHGG